MSSSAAKVAASSSKTSSSSAAKPSSSSSSSAKPSSSSSSAKPSSASSSSSSSAKPAPATGTQLTPYISANAWMSFFLFACLVIIILQGPLGLSQPTNIGVPGLGMNPFGGLLGGGLGCGGFVAAAVPWCAASVQPAQVVQPYAAMIGAPIPQAVIQQPMLAQPVVQYVNQPLTQQPMLQYQQQLRGMGGQGYVATPEGGGGYSWYVNPGVYQQDNYRPRRRQPVTMQYQRQGMQVQVSTQGTPSPWYSTPFCSQFPYACQGPIPVAYAQEIENPTSPQMQVQTGPGDVPLPVQMGEVDIPLNPALANLESAFYPLLVGAIALLVIFDYAS